MPEPQFPIDTGPSRVEVSTVGAATSSTGVPAAKGTYILIVVVALTKRLEIGRLGSFTIVPGYYAYVGSAFGAGGLQARLAHHLESMAAPHWHIDYLLQLATPVEVWYSTADRKLEHQWAELLKDWFRSPIPRFGSSDYRRSTTTHLFYSKRSPSFRQFQQKIADDFIAEIQVGCWRFASEPGRSGLWTGHRQ